MDEPTITDLLRQVRIRRVCLDELTFLTVNSKNPTRLTRMMTKISIPSLQTLLLLVLSFRKGVYRKPRSCI